MKKTFVILMAAGMMLLAGCDKADLAIQKAAQKMTLSALLPTQETKTSLDATDKTKVTWTEGDKIHVFALEGSDTEIAHYNEPFTLTEGAGTVKGTFTGEIDESPLYALYPYDSGNTYFLYDDIINAEVIRVWLKSSQRPSPGGFDPEAALMYGTISKGGLINFSHAVGFIKVTVPSDMSTMVRISITAEDGAPMTGDIGFLVPDFTPVVDSANCAVTLGVKSGFLEAGGEYYLAVIPFTSRNVTVEYMYRNEANKNVFLTKSSTAELSVAAGEVKTITVDMTGVTPTYGE